MATASGGLIDSMIQLPQEIAAIALSDPLSLVLVVMGSLMLAASVGVFGYLTLGALLDLFTPSIRQGPPREAQ